MVFLVRSFLLKIFEVLGCYAMLILFSAEYHSVSVVYLTVINKFGIVHLISNFSDAISFWSCKSGNTQFMQV